MRARKAERILHEISSGNLSRLLRDSHHEIDGHLASIIAQLKLQSDSTFGDGKPWSKASYAGFGDCLIAHGKCLIDLGENFNSAKPPQWVLDQQVAYEQSAIGRLSRDARRRHTATRCLGNEEEEK